MTTTRSSRALARLLVGGALMAILAVIAPLGVEAGCQPEQYPCVQLNVTPYLGCSIQIYVANCSNSVEDIVVYPPNAAPIAFSNVPPGGAQAAYASVESGFVIVGATATNACGSDNTEYSLVVGELADIRGQQNALPRSRATTSPFGPQVTIDLLTQDFPQGTFLYGTHGCACGGQVPTSVKLKPTSGTGPVFTATPQPGGGFSAYFLIDNLTALGTYDLETRCPNNSVSVVPQVVNYRGYTGYIPSGRLFNSLTGNVIRGASVAIYRELGNGVRSFVQSLVANDGTYFFDVPPGDYSIRIQYELSGLQWRGPFTVGASAKTGSIHTPVPSVDIELPPVTNDVSPPTAVMIVSTDSTAHFEVLDPGVGLSVVELLGSAPESTEVTIDDFVGGEDSVAVRIREYRTAGLLPVSVRTVDQLGNVAFITLPNLVDVAPGEQVQALAPRLTATPSPFRAGTIVRLAAGKSPVERVGVYDVAGRLRRTLELAADSNGQYSAWWDGADESGSQVRAGLYFLHASNGNGSYTARVVRVR